MYGSTVEVIGNTNKQPTTAWSSLLPALRWLANLRAGALDAALVVHGPRYLRRWTTARLAIDEAVQGRSILWFGTPVQTRRAVISALTHIPLDNLRTGQGWDDCSEIEYDLASEALPRLGLRLEPAPSAAEDAFAAMTTGQRRPDLVLFDPAARGRSRQWPAIRRATDVVGADAVYVCAPGAGDDDATIVVDAWWMRNLEDTGTMLEITRRGGPDRCVHIEVPQGSFPAVSGNSGSVVRSSCSRERP